MLNIGLRILITNAVKCVFYYLLNVVTVDGAGSQGGGGKRKDLSDIFMFYGILFSMASHNQFVSAPNLFLQHALYFVIAVV